MKNVVIFEDISSERKEELESKGINIIPNFKNIIERDRAFQGSRREILSILGTNNEED